MKDMTRKTMFLIIGVGFFLLILSFGTSCAGRDPGTHVEPEPINETETPYIGPAHTPAADLTSVVAEQTAEALASPIPSPIVFGPAGERERETWAEDSEMEVLVLPTGDSLFPAVYSTSYRKTEISKEETDSLARQTAIRLWGSADLVNGMYEGPASETEYGRFTERVGAFMGSVNYVALWDDWEADPFLYGDHVFLTEAEAADLVMGFLTNAGWDTFVEGSPQIEEAFSSGEDPKVAGAQTLVVYWPEKIPDLDMRTASVRAEILNGRLSHVTLSFVQYESVEQKDPDYLLSAEEALYCLNYARSLIHDKDHPLMTYPYLQSVWPTVQYDFSTDSGAYVPTWVFLMSSDREDKSGMRTEIYVVAATGIVETGTNAGNMPSPYEEF